MGFLEIIAWARKVQNRIHEYAESIGGTNKREGNQQLPSDKPVEVRGVISLDEKTMANFAAQNQSEHPTQKSIKNATWAAFWAVSAYAVVTAFMWCQMIKQNRIASTALRQSTESFRIDERAWVEFEPVKPAPYSPRTDKFGALFEYDLYIKNVGKSVARDIEFRANRSGEYGSIANGNDAKGMAWTQDQLMLGKVPSGADIPFQNPFEKTLAPDTTATNPFVFKGQEPIYEMTNLLVGRIDYCDAFGVKHWKKFCFFVANSKGEFWPCREGNDEDRNSEEPTPEIACRKPN
jgi:hypothetical protein